MIDTAWLLDALEAIDKGLADRLSKDNITVYRVRNVIRIDIKEE